MSTTTPNSALEPSTHTWRMGEPMTEIETKILAGFKQAAEVLGEIPAKPDDLGTQEPAYRAYKIVSDEIERIEARQQANGE